MQAKSWLSPGPGVRVLSVDRVGGRWVVAAVGRGSGVCPGCGEESTHRHSWRQRRLQDLPIQGANVTLQLRLSRWRCRNIECRRKTFVEQMPGVFPPLARRTRRVAELVHLFGHSAGGKPGERLMGCLGAPVSDDTILRHLKRESRIGMRRHLFGWRASTIGVGAKAAHTAQSWWILSGVRS
jgi:hypothetical protein